MRRVGAAARQRTPRAIIANQSPNDSHVGPTDRDFQGPVVEGVVVSGASVRHAMTSVHLTGNSDLAQAGADRPAWIVPALGCGTVPLDTPDVRPGLVPGPVDLPLLPVREGRSIGRNHLDPPARGRFRAAPEQAAGSDPGGLALFLPFLALQAALQAGLRPMAATALRLASGVASGMAHSGPITSMPAR